MMQPTAAPAGEPPPVPHMHPKIASLLHHCGLSYWIPMLEAEEPEAVKEFDRFVLIGKHNLRVLLEDMNELHEEHEREQKLPPDKLDLLIKTLYPSAEAKKAAAAPAAPAPPTPAPPADQPETVVPARDRWHFEQSAAEARIVLRGLPMGIKAKDVTLRCLAMTISLAVKGEVVLSDAKLHAMVVSDDAEFDLQDAPGRQSRVLTVTLPKANNLTTVMWPALLKAE